MEIVRAIVTVFHLLLSLGLVALILLQSGKGGGLSDVFGGGMSASSLGGSTVVERNLSRLTVVVATLFGITTITLAILLS
ncbi:MAG: preprotein translocase subunit SecG [Acidimicrobiia bacterium]|nr:preprotein translocase subunit SecG [Acidimicrobiia bacterium]